MASREFAGLEEFIKYTAERPGFWAVFEREVLQLRWRKPYERVLDLSRGVQ
jgi:acetyl-CoA synthetase